MSRPSDFFDSTSSAAVSAIVRSFEFEFRFANSDSNTTLNAQRTDSRVEVRVCAARDWSRALNEVNA